MLKLRQRLTGDRGDAVLVTVVIAIPLIMLAFMFSVGLSMNAWAKTSFADAAQASAHTAASKIGNNGYLNEGSINTFVSEYMRLTGRTPGTAQQIANGGFSTAEASGLTCKTVEVNGVKHPTPYIEISLDRTRAKGVTDQDSPLYVSSGGSAAQAVFTLNKRVNYRVISATVYEASTSLLGDGFAMLGEDAGCYTSESRVSGITFGANEDLSLIGGDAACWIPSNPTDIEDAAMKTQGSIKLYSGPDYTCPVVGYLNSPYVLATHEYGSFFKISYGGKDYWVNNLETRAADACENRDLADRTVTLNPAIDYSTAEATGVKTYSAPFPDCVTGELFAGEEPISTKYEGIYGTYMQVAVGVWVHSDDLKAMRVINFNPNGGVGGGHIRTYEGGNVTEFAAPTRSGYQFSGWFTHPTGGTKVTFPRAMTGDVTYYAQWGTNFYTISYNGNGGNVINCSPTTYSINSGPIEPKASHCATVNRPGYTFAGFSPASIPTGSTGNKEFVAQWNVVTYNIRYEGNGGTVPANCGPNNYTVASGKITPTCIPSRKDYQFIGWSPREIMPGSTGAQTFTAQWSLKQYTVNFNSRGGDWSTSQTVNHGARAWNPGNPGKNGWNFGGWGPSPASGAPGNTNFGLPITSNTTYYGHWWRDVQETKYANAHVTIGQYTCNTRTGEAGASGTYSWYCARAYIDGCPGGFNWPDQRGSYVALSNGWTLNWGNWTQPGRHGGPYNNFTARIVGNHPTCSATTSWRQYD